MFKINQEIMVYETREQLKDEGWMRFAESSSAEEKVFYLLHYIITAHYWRCREFIESQKNCNQILRKIRGRRYYKGYKLDIDHYTEHWVASFQNRDFMKNGVFEEISKAYPPKKSKYLPEGYTIYQMSSNES